MTGDPDRGDLYPPTATCLVKEQKKARQALAKAKPKKRNGKAALLQARTRSFQQTSKSPIEEGSTPGQKTKVTTAEPSKTGTERVLVNTNANVKLPDNSIDASRYLKEIIADLEDDNDDSPRNEEEIVLHLSTVLRGFCERRSVEFENIVSALLLPLTLLHSLHYHAVEPQDGHRLARKVLIQLVLRLALADYAAGSKPGHTMPEVEWESAYDLLGLLSATLNPMPQATQALHSGALTRAYGSRLAHDLKRMAVEAWDEDDDESNDLLPSLESLNLAQSVGEESGESPEPEDLEAGGNTGRDLVLYARLLQSGDKQASWDAPSASGCCSLGSHHAVPLELPPDGGQDSQRDGSTMREPSISCEGSGTNGSVLGATSFRTSRTAVTSSVAATGSSRLVSELSHIRMRHNNTRALGLQVRAVVRRNGGRKRDNSSQSMMGCPASQNHEVTALKGRTQSYTTAHPRKPDGPMGPRKQQRNASVPAAERNHHYALLAVTSPETPGIVVAAEPGIIPGTVEKQCFPSVQGARHGSMRPHRLEIGGSPRAALDPGALLPACIEPTPPTSPGGWGASPPPDTADNPITQACTWLVSGTLRSTMIQTNQPLPMNATILSPPERNAGEQQGDEQETKPATDTPEDIPGATQQSLRPEEDAVATGEPNPLAGTTTPPRNVSRHPPAAPPSLAPIIPLGPVLVDEDRLPQQISGDQASDRNLLLDTESGVLIQTLETAEADALAETTETVPAKVDSKVKQDEKRPPNSGRRTPGRQRQQRGWGKQTLAALDEANTNDKNVTACDRSDEKSQENSGLLDNKQMDTVENPRQHSVRTRSARLKVAMAETSHQPRTATSGRALPSLPTAVTRRQTRAMKATSERLEASRRKRPAEEEAPDKQEQNASEEGSRAVAMEQKLAPMLTPKRRRGSLARALQSVEKDVSLKAKRLSPAPIKRQHAAPSLISSPRHKDGSLPYSGLFALPTDQDEAVPNVQMPNEHSLAGEALPSPALQDDVHNTGALLGDAQPAGNQSHFSPLDSTGNECSSNSTALRDSLLEMPSPDTGEVVDGPSADGEVLINQANDHVANNETDPHPFPGHKAPKSAALPKKIRIKLRGISPPQDEPMIPELAKQTDAVTGEEKRAQSTPSLDSGHKAPITQPNQHEEVHHSDAELSSKSVKMKPSPSSTAGQPAVGRQSPKPTDPSPGGFSASALKRLLSTSPHGNRRHRRESFTMLQRLSLDIANPEDSLGF